MPKGPNGEKRPADVIGAAVLVGRIATGEVEDDTKPDRSAQREGGRRGAILRNSTLTPARRSAAGRAAAKARWTEAGAGQEKKGPQEQ